MRIITNTDYTVFKLTGEIDHHTAKIMREEIDSTLLNGGGKHVILDFKGVEFMDSSGIGLVLGRYKLVCELDGNLTLQNLPRHLSKVMKIAGIEKLNISLLEGASVTV